MSKHKKHKKKKHRDADERGAERRTLLLITGPSCAGKSPLLSSAQAWFEDELGRYEELVVHHSRSPRPGEKDGEDYHFRSKEELEALRGDDRFLVFDVRGERLAIDLDELCDHLAQSDVVYEGNHEVCLALIDHPRVRERATIRSVFVSPLSADEVRDVRRCKHPPLPDLITTIMRARLLRRLHTQQQHVSLRDLEDTEKRAAGAVAALADAHRFDRVIVNHDGEDSDHWTVFVRPIGDARRAVLALRAFVQGEHSEVLERWNEQVIRDGVDPG